MLSIPQVLNFPKIRLSGEHQKSPIWYDDDEEEEEERARRSRPEMRLFADREKKIVPFGRHVRTPNF